MLGVSARVYRPTAVEASRSGLELGLLLVLGLVLVLGLGQG